MKKQCCFCGSCFYFFGNKIEDGYICSECKRCIPSNINLRCSESSYLRPMLEENKKRREKFSCSASYGSLFIDGKNNMFCISKQRHGMLPLFFGDIFYINELTNVGFFCTNARVVERKVLCDISFTYTTDTQSTEVIIARMQKCDYEVCGNRVSWSEPQKLSIFRELFKQMIDNEYSVLNIKLQRMQEMKRYISEEDKNTEWAKGVFFLGTEETTNLTELRNRRNFLIKKFHPDVNDEKDNSTAIASQINKAYEILVNNEKR